MRKKPPTKLCQSQQTQPAYFITVEMEGQGKEYLQEHQELELTPLHLSV